LLLPPKNPFFPPLLCQLLSSFPPFSTPPVLMRGKTLLAFCKILFYLLLPPPSCHLHSNSTCVYMCIYIYIHIFRSKFSPHPRAPCVSSFHSIHSISPSISPPWDKYILLFSYSPRLRRCG
jgi:hypothetical protein